MNKRHYEHTLPNIRGSLSNTYVEPYASFTYTVFSCPAILDVVNYKFHFLELFTGYTNYMLTWAYLLENPS